MLNAYDAVYHPSLSNLLDNLSSIHILHSGIQLHKPRVPQYSPNKPQPHHGDFIPPLVASRFASRRQFRALTFCSSINLPILGIYAKQHSIPPINAQRGLLRKILGKCHLECLFIPSCPTAVSSVKLYACAFLPISPPRTVFGIWPVKCKHDI